MRGERKPSKRKHWGEYPPEASVMDRYRHCLVCGHWIRNWWFDQGQKPLIHKGGKP